MRNWENYKALWILIDGWYDFYAMSVTPEIREQLKSSGKWPVFVKERRELEAGGMDVEAATKEALRRAEAYDGGKVNERDLVSASVFAGKTASRTAEFNWVLTNLYVKDVKPEDAPDAPAWTILQMCRKNHSFAEDLIGRGLIKMLPAKLEDGPQDDRFDGQDTFDAWAMIRGRENG